MPVTLTNTNYDESRPAKRPVAALPPKAGPAGPVKPVAAPRSAGKAAKQALDRRDVERWRRLWDAARAEVGSDEEYEYDDSEETDDTDSFESRSRPRKKKRK